MGVVINRYNSEPSTWIPGSINLVKITGGVKIVVVGENGSPVELFSKDERVTATGLSVLSAVSQAAARTAIGAGTSSLTLGTTASTAKAGNYVPTWTEVTGKPSTFTPATHTHTAAQISDVGAPNGVAGLDGTGRVPAAQLPSYVDDVLEFANLAAFPATGETSKLYVALDTNRLYRWSGSAYVWVNSSAGTADQAVTLTTGRTFSLSGDAPVRFKA